MVEGSFVVPLHVEPHVGRSKKTKRQSTGTHSKPCCCGTALAEGAGPAGASLGLLCRACSTSLPSPRCASWAQHPAPPPQPIANASSARLIIPGGPFGPFHGPRGSPAGIYQKWSNLIVFVVQM